MSQKTPETKPYYDVLDGLRGTAAIVILVFHYLEMIYPDYSDNAMGHGFLAVDFFFCLSGFVIGFAYDHRMKTIGIKNFFINRLIRLHPLVFLGSIIGFAGYILNPWMPEPLEWGKIWLALLGSILLIPTPILSNRFGGLFPYNTPSWSLFLEYLVNIIYAFVLCRLRKSWLLALGIICAAWLMYTSYRSGWLINGWSIDNIWDGFPRVCFSFTAGLLIFRFKWILNNKLGFIFPFILLMGVFLYPHFERDWLAEGLMVIVAFPLIISIGAGAGVTGWVRKFCVFIGRLSYPLYMTHITTVWIFTDYFNATRPAGMELVVLVAVLCLFNLSFAYFIMKVYDEPVRAWLTRKRKKLSSN